MKLADTIAAGDVYFIAEMSANHGGDLERALAIVDAAADAGASCLKVQTYTADTLTLDCDNEYFRITGGLWDGMTLHDLYADASFPWEWHEPVMRRCEERDIDFLSTPFDETAVDFLEDLGVGAYKIASFELVHIPLIRRAAATGKTMIISTGMGSIDEISDAVCACRTVGNDDIVLLRCCSEYPADPADMNLASILDMAERFGCEVGFSDHSMGHAADVVAAVLGASVIEKHFCLDRATKTADSAFSMTPGEYADMVSAVRSARRSMGEPLYGPTVHEEGSLVFRRSVFACSDIRAGEPFTTDNIRIVRPAHGASPKHYDDLLGTLADRDYAFGEPVFFPSDGAALGGER